MDAVLFCLDRIEGEYAVLIGDNDVSRDVPLNVLPTGAHEGKVYRAVGETYVEDPVAEKARRERVRALQERLRRKNN